MNYILLLHTSPLSLFLQICHMKVDILGISIRINAAEFQYSSVNLKFDLQNDASIDVSNDWTVIIQLQSG